MNTQTKTLLGLAAVAGVGYLVYKNMQDKKKAAETANFANFVKSDKVRMVENNGPCQGDFGKDINNLYICCRSGFRSATTLSKPCAEVL
jgi:hypothetical protein